SFARRSTRAPPILCAATRLIIGLSGALLAAAVFGVLLEWPGHIAHAQERGDAVQRVQTIGFTVADVDREAGFFTRVLQFEKTANFRLVGAAYGTLQGVFNASMRIVHLRLGDQVVELTQYASPPAGRSIPVPSYSNDQWFQHMAIVVRDMDAAYKILQD